MRTAEPDSATSASREVPRFRWKYTWMKPTLGWKAAKWARLLPGLKPSLHQQIYQSGVLLLAYSFGLPIIASDVGSFRNDIIEGKTGYLNVPCDAADSANTIETYFESDLFKALDRRRPEIRNHAWAWHSWDLLGEMTRDVTSAASFSPATAFDSCGKPVSTIGN